jgi:DNA-binding NtrC family response regulator
MKILIVDDEIDLGIILSFGLKNLGHETVTLNSTEEAINYLSINSCDAVLCDFQMPRINGLGLFEWMKKNNKHIPFYILTGEPSIGSKKLLEMGIKDILFKPQDLLHLSNFFK